jgi:mRNA interferase RelE/StbE
MRKSSGNKQYSIELGKSVIKEDIPSLGKSAYELIQKAIEERLTVDPISFGKPLRYSLTGSRRLRVSRYRIIYHVDVKQHKVIITAIHHRKDSYDY